MRRISRALLVPKRSKVIPKTMFGIFAGNRRSLQRLGMKLVSFSKRISDLDEIDLKYKILRRQNRKRNLIGRNLICGV